MRIEYPGERQIPHLRALWQEVFGDSDAFLDSFFATAFSFDRCRCIPDDDRIAAVLYWIDCTLGERKLAYLYAVATHPDYRGKGLCRRLMVDTHDLLRSRGYAGIVLVPQEEDLRAMYAKMGYENAGGMDEFNCTAADITVPLRAVGPGEFATLRRTLLPKNSVIQEGAGLAFLARQLQFYAGDGFLLAGYEEKGSFHGLELLGNPQAAPGILAALGCHSGIFRVPGSIPFAMFHTLTPDPVYPSYFGFGFD